MSVITEAEMLSNKKDELIDLFPRVKDAVLTLLLRHAITEHQQVAQNVPEPSHRWNDLQINLGKLIAEALSAYGRHSAATKGYVDIYAHESVHWEYRDDGYRDVDMGFPHINQKNPYPLPGVALLPLPSDNYASNGWELYWLSDGTLLSASRTAHKLSNSANQSSTLEIVDQWIDRTFAPISLEEIASQITFSQLCLLLEQMLTKY
jgi:hypothetical protein